MNDASQHGYIPPDLSHGHISTELPSNNKYDVLLINRKGAQTIADSAWAVDVSRKKVIDAVQELLVMKEKDQHGTFDGDIIIRPANLENPDYPKCEEDGAISYNGSGGSVSVLRTAGAGSNRDHNRAQRQLEDQSMIGECCGHTAMRHSIHSPFPCRECACARWDSGE